jgi:hypothetical protein
MNQEEIKELIKSEELEKIVNLFAETQQISSYRLKEIHKAIDRNTEALKNLKIINRNIHKETLNDDKEPLLVEINEKVFYPMRTIFIYISIVLLFISAILILKL